MIGRQAHELVESGPAHFPSQMLEACAAKEMRRHIPQRFTRVEHDDGFAASLEHAEDLADSSFGVRRVMQHAMAIHEVERLRRKGKVLCVCLGETAGEPFEQESLACQAE